MTPDTRRPSLTQLEVSLAPSVPAEERRQKLNELSHDHRPDLDTISAVIPMLSEGDDSLRNIAEILLTMWGQPSVTALLHALRSCDPLEVPLRLAIIKQLARMGPTAARAETLLASFKDDPDVGAEAQAAIQAIRRDFDDLVGRFGQWAVELVLLGLLVAAPMVAVRKAAPNMVWPPLGIVIGFGALTVAGLMLARYQFSGDLLPEAQTENVVQTNRWKVYVYMGVLAGSVGFALGLLMSNCGGVMQRLLGN